MARLLYVLPHSTDDPRRAATALEAAVVAAETGHEVALWLTDEGVRLAVKGVVDALLEAGPRLASDSLAALQQRDAPLCVSKPCFEGRGFAAEQLAAGGRLAEPAELATLVADGWAPIPT